MLLLELQYFPGKQISLGRQRLKIQVRYHGYSSFPVSQILLEGEWHSCIAYVGQTLLWKEIGAGDEEIGRYRPMEVFSLPAFHLSLRQRKCFKVLEKKKNTGSEKVQDGLIYSFI